MPSNIQDLQWFQDSTNEVIMVLESNIDIFSSLVKFYQGLANNAHFPLSTICAEDVASFLYQMEDMTSELRLQISRARTLLKVSNDRKELVSLLRLKTYICQFDSQDRFDTHPCYKYRSYSICKVRRRKGPKD